MGPTVRSFGVRTPYQKVIRLDISVNEILLVNSLNTSDLWIKNNISNYLQSKREGEVEPTIWRAAIQTVLIENLPDVRDINVLLDAIAGIGDQVDRVNRSTVKINGSTIQDISVDYEYIKKIRASYYLLGALLGKYKHLVQRVVTHPSDNHDVV